MPAQHQKHNYAISSNGDGTSTTCTRPSSNIRTTTYAQYTNAASGNRQIDELLQDMKFGRGVAHLDAVDSNDSNNTSCHANEKCFNDITNINNNASMLDGNALTFTTNNTMRRKNYHRRRRDLLVSSMGIISTILLTSSTSSSSSSKHPNPANAFPLLAGQERRQLELCLVTILRVQYWAQTMANNIATVTTEYDADGNITSNRRQWNVQTYYIETRLGSKALLTGRIGGGASEKVYQLASLQIKGCLEDAVYYSKAQGQSSTSRLRAENAADDIVDSLASVVEFDGLETTQDPSPRSSLMISMFKVEKGVFVQRLLLERMIPACRELVGCFGSDVKQRCEVFIQRNYPDEIVV